MSVPAAWPSVIAAVTTVAKAGTSGRVTRGRDTTNELGDFLMVGVSSLSPSSGGDSAGTFDQEMQTFGGARVETGTVNLLGLSRNGDADADAACTAVFALVAAFVSAVRADPTLGVTAFDYLVTEVQTGTVTESLNNDEGAVASLSLVLHYKARIL